MFTRKTIVALAVALGVSGAFAGEEKPCVCTTWKARLAEYEARKADITRRCREDDRRLTALQKELRNPARKMSIEQMRDEYSALAQSTADCKARHSRLCEDLKTLIAEITAHDARYGPKVRHKPVRTWALIELLPEDPVLAWIIAQDGTNLSEQPVAQKKDAKERIAKK